MRDPVRVSLELNYEEDTARIHGTTGEVDTGGSTFSFEIDGTAHTETNPRDTE